MTYRFLHRTGLPSYRSAYQYSYSASPIGPNRSGPRLLQLMRPMLSSGSSWLHASLVLLDLFDSARFDPSGRLIFSHGPSQLPCSCGVGASPAAFSSAWALVDSAYLNQTSEQTRPPTIDFHCCPTWLSPTRLPSSCP